MTYGVLRGPRAPAASSTAGRATMGRVSVGLCGLSGCRANSTAARGRAGCGRSASGAGTATRQASACPSRVALTPYARRRSELVVISRPEARLAIRAIVDHKGWISSSASSTSILFCRHCFS